MRVIKVYEISNHSTTIFVNSSYLMSAINKWCNNSLRKVIKNFLSPHKFWLPHKNRSLMHFADTAIMFRYHSQSIDNKYQMDIWNFVEYQEKYNYLCIV